MKRKLICFLTLLLLLLGIIWSGSSSSLRWYSQVIYAASDGLVRIENLQGYPLWELHADELIVQNEGVIVRIHQPQLTWSAWQLLWGRVHIEHAQVSLLEIEIFDTQAPSTFALTDLNFLRFFEAENLTLKRLTYKDSNMAWALHDLSGTEVSFGREVSGQLLGFYKKTDLKFSLNGAYQQWEAVLHWKEGQESRALLSVQGFAWDQGKLHVQAGTWGQLDARWSHRGDDWRLVSDVSLKEAQHQLDVRLVLDVNPVSDRYQWQGEGSFAAKHLLSVTWPFLLQGAWDERDPFVRIEDQEQKGNWLNIRYEEEKLAFRWHAQKWKAPLKNVDGWLSADAWLWLSLPEYTWQASFSVLDSEWMSLPLALQGEVSGEGLDWQLEDVSANFLGVDFLLQGQQYEGKLALHVQAKSSHIQNLLAFYGVDADAQLQAELNVRGMPNDLLVSWQADFEHVNYDDFHSQKAHLEGEVQPKTWLAVMQLTLTNARWAKAYHWSEIALALDKDQEKVRVSSHAKGALSWLLACDGQQRGEGWFGQLDQLKLSLDQKPLFHVKANAWSWQNNQLTVDEHDVIIQTQKARWRLHADAQGPDAYLHVEHVNLAQLNPYLTAWQFKETPTRLDVSWQGRWNQPVLKVQLDAKAWQLLDEERAMQWQLKKPSFQLSYEKGHWQWQGAFGLHERDEVSLSGYLPWFWSIYPWHHEAIATQKGQSTLKVAVHDMSVWQHLWLFDQDIVLAGDVYAQVIAHDLLGSPTWQADLKAEFSHIQLMELGVDLQASLAAKWEGEQGDADLRLRVGDGQATLHGDLVWPWQQSKLGLVLSNFPLRQLNDNTVISDGQLQLYADSDEIIVIEGALSAKKMVLSFPDALPQASQDIVWRTVKKVEKEESVLDQSRLSIDLSLADDAKIVGEGMEMGLKGQLHLSGSVNQPELTGDILVHDGFFVFRHVELAVQEGSHIIFTGDLSKPRLNIRVAKQQEEMLLGVHISGTLDAIQSVFYSDPAMTQTEILAYLATGKSLGNMEGNDLSMAANVATFFLNSDGNVLMTVRDVLQQTFGLDSLDWEITPSGGRVVAGKKLNQRLNVQLEQSLQAQASTALTLEYMLVRGVAIFARQMSNQAPVFGLRYRKVWNASDKKVNVQPK